MKSNSTDQHKPLTEKQEKILSAFVDGEASWWQSFIIVKSLQKNFEARQYVDSLERNAQSFRQKYISESAGHEGSAGGSQDVSLTDRVLNRISQEERLSLLRSLPSGYSGPRTLIGKIFDHDWFGIQSAVREKLAWGSLGAACASLFILFFIPAYSDSNKLKQINQTQLVSLESVDQNSILAGNTNSDNSHLVAFNNSDSLQGNVNNHEISYYALSNASPDLLSRYQKQPYGHIQNNQYAPEASFYLRKKYIAPQVVEVDWVRSAGRVKVLRDPNGKASILWVQKKQNYGPQNYASVNNMPMNSAIVNSNSKTTGPAVAFVSNK